MNLRYTGKVKDLVKSLEAEKTMPSIPWYAWLLEQFEYDYCSECHGDAQDHDAIPFLDNWLARCKSTAVCHLPNCEEHKEVSP